MYRVLAELGVEYKVSCMNGCHLLVAILDCGAEMLSLFHTRQGQIGWCLLVFTCVFDNEEMLILIYIITKRGIQSNS